MRELTGGALGYVELQEEFGVDRRCSGISGGLLIVCWAVQSSLCGGIKLFMSYGLVSVH